MADGTSLFHGRRRRGLPVILQTEATECGLACLAMISAHHGNDLGLSALRQRFPLSSKGVSLARLIEVADGIGLQARALRAELAYLGHVKGPCILHWDLNHFVVLSRVTDVTVEIHDPARGSVTMSLEEASRHFTGIVVELGRREGFVAPPEHKRVPIARIVGRVVGMRRSLVQILVLAGTMEMLALLLPFQMQWIVDDVLATSDTSLLAVVTGAFLVVLGLQAMLTVARGWLLTWVGASMASQWVTNLFSHLMRLPIAFFERRQIGEILSRFSSVRTVQATITGSFVGAVLDGVMAAFSLVVLACYSGLLTSFVLVAFLIYCLLRWAAYRSLWRINEEMLALTAKEQTLLLESVRGAQAIKLANGIPDRVAHMANATLDTTERSMRSQRIAIAFDAVSQGLFGAQRTFAVGMGAWLAMRHAFSAGMLIAFVAYADQFTTKIGALVDRIVDFRMLRLHGERIADIATTEAEVDEGTGIYDVAPEPSIEVSELGFRYAADDAWIFRDLNFSVRAGESVAIVGPSGCGKTTLAKVILGLLEHAEGSIAIGGVDVGRLGLRRYRDMVGAVMQNDHLFTGSIAENIAMFTSHPDPIRIVEAARAACIHDDIAALPMGYDTFVGDMGATLSGGQKQRVLLARALYKRPSILLLDEATSHLDGANEAQVNRHVAAMNITRVIIAHRAETIASADRIIDLAAMKRKR